MRIRRQPLLLLIVLALASLLIVVAPSASYSYQDRDLPFASASVHHPAGTDALGRDRLVRVSAALVISLVGALAASLVATAAAACIGTLAAFVPAGAAGLVMLVCDAFLALPWLFLLMMVRSLLPLTVSPANSAVITFMVLAALGWPACARAVYREALNLKNSEWMLQARAEGLRGRQLIHYLVPGLLPLLLPQFFVSVPAFLMAEANLGALGLGIGEPLPSLGGMLLELDNSATLLRTNWVYLPPALLILVLLLLEAVVVEA